jgi:hypothetical protein
MNDSILSGLRLGCFSPRDLDQLLSDSFPGTESRTVFHYSGRGQQGMSTTRTSTGALFSCHNPSGFCDFLRTDSPYPIFGAITYDLEYRPLA